ncbi:MAG TPA: MazG family protein [Streptosporangiaceae bacterium]|nr:MazG family protein [Streptosporangiaceae bacterium]
MTEPAAPGARLLGLVEVMDRLRTGCPWDARQTHASLAPYLLEETYEALEALDSGDPLALRDELGDVLLQVVFHARLAAERTDGTGWTIDDVADAIITKLTRRHPHVFGDVAVSGAEEVKANWETIKAAERQAATGARGSALDSVPMGQPALALAAALQRRAQRSGVPGELADLAGDPAVSEVGAELFALAARTGTRAWTRSRNCAPPPAPTASGSGSGSRNKPPGTSPARRCGRAAASTRLG